MREGELRVTKGDKREGSSWDTLTSWESIGSIYHQSLWDQPCTYICYTTERLMHLRVSQLALSWVPYFACQLLIDQVQPIRRIIRDLGTFKIM
ncbi:hypothetical protein L3X38_011880 [Prunus dulcis]|uniref:Uncharacterized protein n=1 Tax=Prunus dulcis TaxID=3755 RepID=A0AAD4ZG38_PRUDU|nr:hypothetical protein L3X38_011880 [Prunus dulcis]